MDEQARWVTERPGRGRPPIRTFRRRTVWSCYDDPIKISHMITIITAEPLCSLWSSQPLFGWRLTRPASRLVPTRYKECRLDPKKLTAGPPVQF